MGEKSQVTFNKKSRTQAINTDSFITGYSRLGKRPVRHLRIGNEESFVKIYAVGDILGKGTFGTVFEVRDMKDNKQWATKVIEKKTTSYQSLKVIEREINILKVLNHPHIIELREVLESGTKIYLIMEKCFTDLSKLTKAERKNLSEMNVKKMVADLTSAIRYLHKNDIVHRDIKAENVLVTDNPQNASDHLYIKLTDFGLSIVRRGRGIENMLTEKCGTLQYMSPEILLSKSYSQQCDVWAIGVITFYMLTSTFPFYGSTDDEIIQKICKNEVPTEKSFAPELIDFLKRVLNKDPAERITAAEMLNHAWLTNRTLMDNKHSHNVVDMMRLCNKDMRVNVEDDSDDPLLRPEHGRSAATVAVKNVTFDKKNRRANASTKHDSRGSKRGKNAH